MMVLRAVETMYRRMRTSVSGWGEPINTVEDEWSV
jgi:hypothetical protein